MMFNGIARLRVSSICVAVGVLVISAGVALAGDFWISVESSHSSRPGMSGQAVLVVRPSGCHEPQDATITATAEGIVNGQRRSVPLRLVAISPGVYEIAREWPSQGSWVVAVNAEYRGLPRAAIIRLGPGGSIPAKLGPSQDGGISDVQVFRRKLAGDDLDSALRAIAGGHGERLGTRATS
jgi:hypothetical protein